MKAQTKAQKQRNEKECIGDVKIIDGVKMQLVGHFDCGRQYWKPIK